VVAAAAVVVPETTDKMAARVVRDPTVEAPEDRRPMTTNRTVLSGPIVPSNRQQSGGAGGALARQCL